MSALFIAEDLICEFANREDIGIETFKCIYDQIMANYYGFVDDEWF